MSAESIDYEDDGELLDPWARFRPPAGGWTAEDLDRIPDLPPHTELIDGSLVFMSPQLNFHRFILRKLEFALYHCMPEGVDVVREMTVTLGQSQRPEPDLMLVREAGDPVIKQSSYAAADTFLVVEVESPESKLRDRRVKPRIYAEAGIKYFWRVENQDDKPVFFTFELNEQSKEYKLTGEHRDRLKVEVPFPIDIDLTKIHRL